MLFVTLRLCHLSFLIVNDKMFIGHFKIITRTQYIRYPVSRYLIYISPLLHLLF